MKRLIRNVTLVFLLLLLVSASSVYAAPPQGQAFYGTVTIDGAPAPDSTSVTAEMNGRQVASTTVPGADYPYQFTISTIDGDQAGDTITFYVNGESVDTVSFAPGQVTQNNLTYTTPPPPPDQHRLTIRVNGEGTTSPSPGSRNYDEGRVVTVRAIPAEGWMFVGWDGSVSDPDSAQTTVRMNSDKTITANFKQEIDMTPPIITGVTTVNITKTTADISWVTDEPSTSQVDYSASPGVLTPLDGTLVTEHLISLNGLNPSTTYTFKVLSQDASGNLAESDEFSFITEGLPATFILSDWDISITEIGDGYQASISFILNNIGDLSGSYEAIMTVNGTTENTQTVELEAGNNQTLNFSTIKTTPGIYSIQVAAVSFSFVIPAPPEPAEEDPNPSWLLVGITVGGLILIISITLLLLKSRYHILVKK